MESPSKDTNHDTSLLATLRAWKKALVTNEDYLHHHKILGVLCLVSFAYRISRIFDDMAFPSHPSWTIPTLAIHWMLTASSMQFKIPQKRIRDGGRIWPQYRLHACCFTTRSILLLGLYWYEQQNNLEPNYDINMVIAMLNMAAADYVTHAFADKDRPNSVRDISMPGWLKLFLSTMQYNATTGVIFGLRCYTIPFFILFVVQTTPFIGTLRRKGVFTSDIGGSVAYSLLLVGGFTAQAIQYTLAGGERMHLFIRCLTLFAANLRFATFIPSFLWPLQDKYVIWTIVYFIIRHVRPLMDQLDVVMLRVVFASLVALYAGSAYIKLHGGYYSNESSKTNLKAQ